MYICSMYMWKCLSILGVLAWLITVAPASSPSSPPTPSNFYCLLECWKFLHPLPAPPSPPSCASCAQYCPLLQPCHQTLVFLVTVAVPSAQKLSLHSPLPPFPLHTPATCHRHPPVGLCSLCCLLSLRSLGSEVKMKGDAFTGLGEKNTFRSVVTMHFYV